MLLCSLLLSSSWDTLLVDTREYFIDRIVDLKVSGDHFFVVGSNKRILHGHLIFKINRQGNILKKMTRNGSGPGEIESIRNISLADGRVYVAESLRPILHIYDLNLNYIRDVKLHSGGTILVNDEQFLGIWRTVYGRGGAHMLTLYAKPDFKPYKRVFPYLAKDQAYLVQQWGGATSGSGNAIAGVLVHDYRIRIFNPQDESYRYLFTAEPSHILPKPKLPKKEIDMRPEDDKAWLSRWHIVHGLYFSEGLFVVTWRYKDQYFFDVIHEHGEFVAKKLLSGTPILDFEDGRLWRIVEKENELGDKSFFVATIELAKMVKQ